MNLVIITAYDEAEHPIPVMRHTRRNLLWSPETIADSCGLLILSPLLAA